MKRWHRFSAIAVPAMIALVVFATSLAIPGLAAPGDTTRVSVASDGTQSSVFGNFDTFPASMSGDGRYVAFESIATNLVPGDTNGDYDVFVRDRVAGTTERVSVASGGTQGNGGSGFGSSISADGRFVAFSSVATNLVPGDTNGASDLFVRDRVAGTTERVSVASGGTQGNGDSTFGSSISADGRFVAFPSGATNLAPADTNNEVDIFVRDRVAETTERVSVASDGTQPNNGSFQPSISADGRLVAFTSAASNLVPGDTNGALDVFVRDRLTGTTARVSVASDGTQVGGGGGDFGPSISADGRFVAFSSSATNLVAGDTNGDYDVFVRDRVAGTTARVSVASDGTQGNSGSGVGSPASMSAEGRYVAFESVATNLVPGDTSGTPAQTQVFVRDRTAGVTEPAHLASDGTQPNSYTFQPSISADGRFVAFTSFASNLVPGDTNGGDDVFVHERGTPTLTSLSLNGAAAYAEAPNAPALNPTDWTFEVWFKDENPTYNHPRARILTKGDIASAEVPYFASIDSNLLYVGLRSGGAARVVTFNLATGGVTPDAWHHLAASFQASSRTLTIYIDGVQRAQGVLASTSGGNSLPLIVGRSGPAGDYWKGKLDDLRIWNVARTSAQIQANYQTELGAAPAGLVGNWRFNEGGGNTAFDSAGVAQNMSLLGGATFSTDTPFGVGPTATPTNTPPATTATPTNTATATAIPTNTPGPTNTALPSATPLPTSTSCVNTSLDLNGTSAYAEAPDGGELNPSNWTFEIWFKDGNATYGHNRTRILTKGDITSANVPYFAAIDNNVLYVGLRSGGAARVLTFNLTTGGISPNAWHHLAASFQASSRTLTVYIDGIQRLQGVLASGSAGNTLPLIVGRSGAGGDFWRGKLDDLRLWSVVRSSAEIATNYQAELSSPPPGLVGNWKFNEGGGPTALDSAGTAQNLALLGGATFSTDTPFGATTTCATAPATATGTRTPTGTPPTQTPFGTWTVRTGGSPVDWWGLACPSTDLCVAVGDGGAIRTSADGGVSWAVRTSGTTQFLRGVACPSTDRCVAVGDSGTILTSADGGVIWTGRTSGTINPLFGVSCPSTDRCVAVGAGGVILTSADGEWTWTVGSGGAVFLRGVACPSTSLCVAVGGFGTVLTSADGGVIWTVRTSGPSFRTLLGVACRSTSLCVAVGTEGTILTSADGGVTWTVRTNGTTQDLGSVACPSTGRCVAVGGAAILTSADGGVTWTVRTSGIPQILYEVACPSTGLCVVVGDGTLQTSVDGGMTWTVRINGPPELFGVACPSAGLCVAVGDVGTILTSGSPGPVPLESPSATATRTPTATSIATATAIATSTATNAPAPTGTNTPSPTGTNTPSPTATNTPAPTVTNTPTPTTNLTGVQPDRRAI